MAAKSSIPRFGQQGFPLWKHPSGRWCKKVRRKAHYFGKVSEDPEGVAAYQKWLDERDDLLSGRIPSRQRGRVTMRDLVNLFLERCEERVASGELSPVSFADYTFVGKLIVKHLGRSTDPEQLRPADFAAFRSALVEKYSPSRLSKSVTVTRMILKWGYEAEHIERLPRFGPDFGVASKKAARIQKAQTGKKLLSRDEVEKLLAKADPKWKAIVLLSLNAGLGNADVARLKLSDVDGDWLTVPRGKTGTDRKAWLWPETRDAVQEAIRTRETPKPGAAEEVLFLSGHGGPLMAIRDTGKRTDLTVQGFRRLADAAGVYRKGVGLYWLRHTTATIADGARDRAAVMAVLGHVDNSITGAYVEHIDDDRVERVCRHVREWLYRKEKPQKRSEPTLRIVG